MNHNHTPLYDQLHLSSPIGVFDSGSGGLTILDSFQRYLPAQDFIYLGDHQYAPYGSRSGKEILALTQRATAYLFEQGCRLVIIACNTASAIALQSLQQKWLPRHAPQDDRAVLGVLVPMVEAISRQPWQRERISSDESHLKGHVAIFATQGTINSQSYRTEVLKRAPNLSVFQQACPDIVPAIEKSLPEGRLDRMILDYVQQLKAKVKGLPVDWAVLGCTHYPLARSSFFRAFQDCYPHYQQPVILSQPDLTAQSLRDYIKRHQQRLQENSVRRRQRSDSEGDRAGTSHYLTTGDPVSVSLLASRFLLRDCGFTRVNYR